MAKRKKSLSSSDDSSSSSSDSDSSSSSSTPPRQNKVKERPRSVEKVSKPPVKSRGREKVEERRKRESPKTRSSDRSSDRRRNQSDSRNRSRSSRVEGRRNEGRKRSKSPVRSHRPRSRRERSKSPKAETKKNLFPIVNKEDSVSLELESGKKNITETTLVSYPNLNKSITEDKTKNEDDRKRRHSSPETFKSMSSIVTVTHNNSEPEKRPRRSPVQRSLRDRVGWDPFQGTNSSSFGDHDDRQLSRGYNDSYTRKDFGRGRGRGRGGGFRGGENRPRNGGGGGMWSNNRSFSRDNHVISDRSGINDKKWKRDLFTDD